MLENIAAKSATSLTITLELKHPDDAVNAIPRPPASLNLKSPQRLERCFECGENIEMKLLLN
jgi:hypothetical protein